MFLEGERGRYEEDEQFLSREPVRQDTDKGVCCACHECPQKCATSCFLIQNFINIINILHFFYDIILGFERQHGVGKTLDLKLALVLLMGLQLLF